MSASGEQVRLTWVDATRGGAVTLVVLMHFVFWVNVPTAGGEPAVQAWKFITGVLSPFRMSLLFALAGVLTSRYILNGWSMKTRNRVLDGFYLFFVWTCAYAAFSLLPLPGMGMPYRSDYLLLEFVAPTTPLWFIAGLASWTGILAWLTPKVNKWPILVTLAISSVLIQTFYPDSIPLRMVYYGFYIAVGVYGAESLKQFGSSPRRSWTAAAALIAFSVMIAQLVWPQFDPLAGVIASLAGIVVGIYVVVALCRVPPAARLLSWVGRRTVTIYLLHVPILLLISAAVENFRLGDLLLFNLVAPIIGTMIVVHLCALAHDWIARSFLAFLVQRPKFTHSHV